MRSAKNAPPVTYSAVISTANADQSPVLSAVVSVLINGFRLSLDLPRQSITAKNLSRTRECVVNLPDAETVEVIERLARTIKPVDDGFDLNYLKAGVGGKLAIAHMTLVPSEAVSALRALECPMQLEAKICDNADEKAHGRILPLGKSQTLRLDVLRVHIDSLVVLGDGRPNKWTPLMTCLREAYRSSRSPTT
jgi:flavin reductase (DIM6/NTAB) family NADH-FMN oxidoreductase RutF